MRMPKTSGMHIEMFSTPAVSDQLYYRSLFVLYILALVLFTCVLLRIDSLQ